MISPRIQLSSVHLLSHVRLLRPCPSPISRAYSNSHPKSWWWHPTIWSSFLPFSSYLQSFPAWRSLPMSQIFSSGGQNIGVSASTSVLFYCKHLAKQGSDISIRNIYKTIYWKDWCWSWNSNILATWCQELTHLKRSWCWEGLRAGGEGDDRGWDGWMASPTRWTWVWVNSGRWWWTGRPGVLQFMGSQRVGHDWATELNWKCG